jgi:hypothetical protein
MFISDPTAEPENLCYYVSERTFSQAFSVGMAVLCSFSELYTTVEKADVIYGDFY